MTRSVGVRAALGAGVAVLAVSALALQTSFAGADPVAAAAGDGAALDAGALVGIAALAGAGSEVRHVMKVAGPEPSLSPSPSAAPSARRGRAGSVGGFTAAWHSGAAGDAATDGSFASWRGEPLQIVGTWSDSTAEEQTDVTSLDKYRNWNGDIDVALGGLASGETWSQAASGAFTARWTQAIRNVKAKRAGRSGTTYIRFAHEMTGDWFGWKVNSSTVGDFKTSWRTFHDILVREFPAAKLVFSPNDGNHSGVDLDQIWPGDEYVDVVGPDTYDGYPDKTNQALWDEAFNATNNGPQGMGAWRAFAKAHGKPLAVPEWGLRNVDNPFYIRKMHDFFVSCAPEPGDTDLAGKCIYEIYFNIVNSGNAGFVIYGGNNPNAAGAYQGLTWGSR